ncbi:Uncharacterized protein TCM_037613 [Theobroma cacao]|uniref:Reverse transcriptase zinc-binding domain-containing protein n=1 Tax=Theobroma cacao TaxID=3641 RepID=A0A061GTC3_THECC|nr:Uncharacterized protein TCM_037613 [Theobroma cacao]
MDSTNGIWIFVWAQLALLKVEVFVWQMLLGKIGVKEELVKRGIQLNSSLLCILCNLGMETCNHLFVECMKTWKI